MTFVTNSPKELKAIQVPLPGDTTCELLVLWMWCQICTSAPSKSQIGYTFAIPPKDLASGKT